MTRLRHWLLNGAFAGTVLLGSVAIWTVLLYDPRPVHAILSVDNLTPRIKAGGELRIRFEIERARACAGEIRRFWLNADTREMLAREEQPGGHSPVGRNTITARVPIPPSITEPGRYIYRAHIVHECGSRTHLTVAPDVLFQVVP